MNRKTWDHLPLEDKKAYMCEINLWLKSNDKYQNFKMGFSGIETFEGGFETGVFSGFPNRVFVYIPADTAVLGFESSFDIPTAYLDRIAEEYDTAYDIDSTGKERDYEELKAVIGEEFSPVRVGNIREMLVEQDYIGYLVQEPESEECISKITYLEEGDDPSTFEKGTGMIVGCSFEQNEIKDALNEIGFDILSEDEYEYLHGGGYRNLFNKRIMERLVAIDTGKHSTKEYVRALRDVFDQDTLRCPNCNGISIGYNTYHMELVSSPCLIKGSDGGSGLHGGYAAYGYLPLSPHYRDPEAWIEYITIRRVVPIPPGLSLCPKDRIAGGGG